MEDFQQLLVEMMHLADRVTLARLGLLKELQIEGDDVKKTAVNFSASAGDDWEKYPAYFRQTFAYIAASVRDGYATLDAPATPVELE
jgi:hypothetical protein